MYRHYEEFYFEILQWSQKITIVVRFFYTVYSEHLNE